RNRRTGTTANLRRRITRTRPNARKAGARSPPPRRKNRHTYSGERETDLDAQAAVDAVLGANVAAVRADRALRDGETQAEAFGGVDAAAVERLEHAIELALRNSGPPVGHH